MTEANKINGEKDNQITLGLKQLSNADLKEENSNRMTKEYMKLIGDFLEKSPKSIRKTFIYLSLRSASCPWLVDPKTLDHSQPLALPDHELQ